MRRVKAACLRVTWVTGVDGVGHRKRGAKRRSLVMFSVFNVEAAGTWSVGITGTWEAARMSALTLSEVWPFGVRHP